MELKTIPVRDYIIFMSGVATVVKEQGCVCGDSKHCARPPTSRSIGIPMKAKRVCNF